jgi:hypothetical protein
MATNKAPQTSEAKQAIVTISAPNFGYADFPISGEILVVHRFSTKLKNEMKAKMEAGPVARGRKIHPAKDITAAFNEARYISPEGWDGFHAAAIRNALISACRLVPGLTMVKGKLSFFCVADGYDAAEPQIPLVRLYGEAVKQLDPARVETGQAYVAIRAAYHDWKANVRIRWDKDQHTLQDVTNLLARAGMQVGICEGRPSSPNSNGVGWGLFNIEQKEVAVAA